MRSISPYSVQMRENANLNNSEYGHFARSGQNRRIWVPFKHSVVLLFIAAKIFFIYVEDELGVPKFQISANFNISAALLASSEINSDHSFWR